VNSGSLRFLFSGAPTSVNGPAIFIDRDGVINCRRPDDYVLDWSQFVFVPGIRAALKQISSLQLPMIVISNQAAVGKGLLEPAGLEEITKRMQQALLEDGTTLTAAYYCPHRQDENCTCRKPKPGLLEQAANDFSIELDRSILMGDSESDVAAARAVGCQPIRFAADARDLGESPKWTEGLAIASKSEELFDVAGRCLHEAQTLRTRRSAVKPPLV
jgi:D-glycero-D-manno-heptose 1,7-bisphosphate phosphatase